MQREVQKEATNEAKIDLNQEATKVEEDRTRALFNQVFVSFGCFGSNLDLLDHENHLGDTFQSLYLVPDLFSRVIVTLEPPGSEKGFFEPGECRIRIGPLTLENHVRKPTS